MGGARTVLAWKAALLSTSLVAGFAGGAAAETASTASDGAGAQTSIQEIVVTARRREERLMDVPAAASALTTQALDRYQSADLGLLGTQINQLEIDQAPSGNRGTITLRGIGSVAGDAGIEQDVSVNIDGVSISRGSAVEESSFDQASVQVLKGPQALYFGKNSPAGIVVLTSANPTRDFSGYARGGYEFNTREPYFEGAVSGPVTDTLRIRLAFHTEDMTGGYIKDVAGPITAANFPASLPKNLAAAGLSLPGSVSTNYPGTKDYAGRLTIEWQPNDKFDLVAKLLVSDYFDSGFTQTNVFFHCAAGLTKPEVLDYGGTNKYITDPYGSCSPSWQSSVGTVPTTFDSHYPGSRGGVPFDNFDTYITSVVMNYHLTPQILLTSTTGYYIIDETSFGTLDSTTQAEATGRNDDYNAALSEEARIATSFAYPVNFNGGLYYETARRTFQQDTMLGYLGLDPATGYSIFSASADRFHGETFSAFGELIWKIVPQVELDGGARYTREHKDGKIGDTYLFPGRGAAYLPAGDFLYPDFTEDNVSPQVTLSWHVTPDFMVYGAYKEGFKSGGIQTPTRYAATTTAQNAVFTEETAKGGEVGVKFNLLHSALSGDLTAYYYEYDGLQLTAYNVQYALFFTQNAGAAIDRGVEGNLNYNLTPEISLRGSLAYNDAYYSNFADAQCYTGQTVATGCVHGVQNLTGTPLPRAPDWSSLLGASWDHRINDTWKIGATVDWKWSDDYQASSNFNPNSWQGAYSLFDASVRFYTGKVEFAVIGTNLLNKLYATLKQDQVLGPAGDISGYLGQPRLLKAQITYRW